MHLAKDERDALRRDAERLDMIERCIRDGSYASIFNDIIAVCQHAYATFGPGPALRTAIDAALRTGEPQEEAFCEPPQRTHCPHGEPIGECQACDEAADHAYDAVREDRMFRP